LTNGLVVAKLPPASALLPKERYAVISFFVITVLFCSDQGGLFCPASDSYFGLVCMNIENNTFHNQNSYSSKSIN